MTKKAWLLLVFIFIVALSFATPNKAAFLNSKMEKDELYKEIQSKSEQHEVKPIDAKIDRVWKAIPGYNGLRVDVEASYKKMKKAGEYDESMLVFEEIPPAVHLDDLEPQPIFRGNPEKPMVSLLINVAWGNEFIPPILKILDEHEVKATFFFDGSWTKANPDLAIMIYKKGHEIGNHAYSHPDLQKRSKAETMEEITKTNDVIFETLNVQAKWFGPPSGSFNQQTVDVAHELKMKTILWTVDTVDWRKPEPTEMVNRVVSKVENGAMILMHPTDPVAKGLDRMIREINSKGLRIGTVNDLMSEKRIE
ncbi:polysaccharide deacetylase family protein [Sporosarcina thermotolerans]|uniref:Polysaccharide deacetylase family protein n=1 Tax=Sporosarcina thermotolerans TaxID=633404 RepID=A0AAW9ACC6_9BACL|nr:polysaccharide deacetylase family protein [Sporosarcina thermotolerans]MDW0117859.1 polysaccharide deacetylase family protein [Sporosarcina thermotolerans]